jgi:hypothetical protein
VTTTIEREFPRPPRALVEGLLTDEYQRARSAALGGTAVPTVARDGGVVTVRFPRRIPLDALPGPLRALAGSGDVTQVDTWTEIGDERCSGTFRTETSLPGSVTGTYDVTPAGTGSRYRVTATAKVNVPLIGGRISRDAEEQVAHLVESELDFAAKWLLRTP